MPRSAAGVTLAIQLPDGAAPLRHRIADAVLASIAAGALAPGDTLPSSRALARHLGVPRSAVVAGYDELNAAGFLAAVAGSGTRVAPGADLAAASGLRSHVPQAPAPTPTPGRGPGSGSGSGSEPRWTMRAGTPDSALIDERDWRRAWAHAARQGPRRESDPAGPVELRRALSDHLRRTRGIVADPDLVVCLPGIGAGLRALFSGLDLPGRQVALEDPGYRAARDAVADVGARARFVPVDQDGLDPAVLRAQDAACYVTPAHQFPTGARLAVDRRLRLVDWAAGRGRLVLEDDYDGEFRYDVSPLPALASMPGALEHVVYLGTASKVLTPAVRLAWVLVPASRVVAVRAAVARASLRVDVVAAAMLTRFIESGALTRHLARVAREYRSRREALQAGLHTHLPQVPLLGVDAGLHLVLELPDGLDDVGLASRLAARGLVTEALSPYRAGRGAPGLVLGYAQLPATAAGPAARVIARTLHDVGGPPAPH